VKLLLKVVMPVDYPTHIPFLRLENLSPEHLDQRILEEYVTQVRNMALESKGNLMIFELQEHLRERIAIVNHSVK